MKEKNVECRIANVRKEEDVEWFGTSTGSSRRIGIRQDFDKLNLKLRAGGVYTELCRSAHHKLRIEKSRGAEELGRGGRNCECRIVGCGCRVSRRQ